MIVMSNLPTVRVVGTEAATPLVAFIINLGFSTGFSSNSTRPSTGRIASRLVTTTLADSIRDVAIVSLICTDSDVSMTIFASYVVNTEAIASSGARLSTMISASSNAVNFFTEYFMFQSPYYDGRKVLQTVGISG
ncbi:hypothetical protein [Aristaeella hokkaidonensis]|uniref:Uncharacterized protein n=1 Tax=Aristaeella hokkaidonensis TaxID=3046382 RepID=A0AC61MWB0_9FIRM|nr:hypothetical protein [Aristaeella hokkaidonensis]QUC67014.1 hypothetical protein JYE49_14465 [Aristaeella hokkaidonensis]